ncbi:MAG: hyuA2 [Chloroflexi bacterium]|nr:hyuA2 [Chloroflexota bacterium]
MSFVVGIDVGGTFTDLVCASDQAELRFAKTLTVPGQQATGVLNGLRKLAAQEELPLRTFLERCRLIVHGTTITTNAFLEQKGARTALLTTGGFRDELEFRRGYKESVFDIRLEPPFQIVPRKRRIGIVERIAATGEVLTPLDESSVTDALAQLAKADIDAVAICLLFSFTNPAHELRIKEMVQQALPGVFVTTSYDVLPQIREYERVSTTAINAYVSPPLASYLDALAREITAEGFTGNLLIMQSNGGVLPPEPSAALGVQGLLSGPAGGIIGALRVAESAGLPHVITADMGGTSYDVGIVRDLRPRITTESWINRHRVAIPMLDIHTIGAGGGSIAWVDDGGALRVGPASAGALPGPACYGRGGERPTVTDADLLLGYLNPEYFLGGELQLDRDAAVRAIETHVARPLNISLTEAAEAIFTVANNAMSNAIRFVLSRSGELPQDFALLAMGGGGGIHAGMQAEDLGIHTIVVPAAAPYLCALGDLGADLKISQVRTFLAAVGAIDLDELNRLLQEMDTQARDRLGLALAGVEVRSEIYLDMRYAGEVHEVTVPLLTRTRRVTALNVQAAVSRFHELHQQRFAHHNTSQPVEVLAVRLDVIGETVKPRLARHPLGPEEPDAALIGTRSVYFRRLGGFVETPVYRGSLLAPGFLIVGPAIVEYIGTTVVVNPGHEALIDQYENCVIEVQREA